MALQIERLSPTTLGGAFDPDYLGNLTQQVETITALGAYALISPHNYGRYYGEIVTDTAAFGTFHQNIASHFASNPLVMFDTDNEFYGMSQTLVVELNQAAINGIRAAGATSQYITVEGNSYTGAWDWTTATDSAGLTNGGTMGNLTDPSDKILYQMHQYLDDNYSGTSTTCQSSTIFQTSLEAATAWLRANGKKGLIGEFAGADNSVCIEALQGGLSYLLANDDVWTGASFWAAGPWCEFKRNPCEITRRSQEADIGIGGDYIFNIEPTQDTTIYSVVLPDMEAIVLN